MALDKTSQNKVYTVFGELFCNGEPVTTVGNHPQYGCDEITVYPEKSIGNRELQKLLQLSKEIGNSMCIGQDKRGYFICYF